MDKRMVIFSKTQLWTTTVPVYHRPHHYDIGRHCWVCDCRVRFEFSNTVSLPLEHARKIGHPCERCLHATWSPDE